MNCWSCCLSRVLAEEEEERRRLLLRKEGLESLRVGERSSLEREELGLIPSMAMAIMKEDEEVGGGVEAGAGQDSLAVSARWASLEKSWARRNMERSCGEAVIEDSSIVVGSAFDASGGEDV